MGSISGRVEAKGSGFPGGTWWLPSPCSSSHSCWKLGFLGILFINDLLNGFGKSHSACTLVFLAVAWDYRSLLGAAQLGFPPESCVVTRLA